ncbi:MAG: biotin synthase BioB [Bacillota bacterium]
MQIDGGGVGMLREIEERILNGDCITGEEALRLTELREQEIYELIFVSNRVTRHYRGLKLELCSIINARSGNCSEDCKFCAQSARYDTGAKAYPMVSPEETLRQAMIMEKAGAKRFSLVTSGRGISDCDLETVLVAIGLLRRETGLNLCASLGIIDEKKALMLKEAGVSMYHHNLETAPSYFSRICTTHSYGDRVETIKAARRAGLRVCAGGIIGLGESFSQRVELALEIRRLGVDSVPVNFLNPIRGTPLGNSPIPPPLSLLHALAIFRLILPGSVIRLCGGRREGLRDLQALALMAGADGVMIGDYLTTKGEDLSKDMQMFADLGLKVS